MRKWYQWNIYYYGDMDEFINSYLRIVIKNCKKIDDDLEWFFIRYWSGGPHIRLRINCPEEVMFCIEKIIKDQVNRVEEINITIWEKEEIIKQQRVLAMREKTKIPDAIFVNKSIIKDNYIPETLKYGVGLVLENSEKIFGLSSEMSLRLVSRGKFKELKYFYSIICFMKYIQLVTEYDKTNICNVYIKIWSDYSGISSNIIRRNLEDKIVIEGEKVISVLEKIEGYDRDIDEDIWDLKISMLLEQQKRIINCSSEYLSIIFNYIHVNNNRLGITPYEEIYVALLVQYLQKNDKEYCV